MISKSESLTKMICKMAYRRSIVGEANIAIPSFLCGVVANDLRLSRSKLIMASAG